MKMQRSVLPYSPIPTCICPRLCMKPDELVPIPGDLTLEKVRASVAVRKSVSS